jgi:hypothetical protein
MALSDEERKARKRERARRWREANPEASRANSRRWREANREADRERRRRWSVANPEASREKDRRWREANPEAHREISRRWRKANPERCRANGRAGCHLRRVRRRGTAITGLPVATAKSTAVRFALFGHRCGWCGADGELWEEHFIPIAAGGLHTPRNIFSACPRCQMKRGAKPPAAWYLSQPFFAPNRWAFICQHCDYDGAGIVQLSLFDST